jgi:hypothetical protein
MTGRTMSERPPEDSDPPELIDEAILAALSNNGRNAAALTTAEERLLDDWIAGRLSEDARKRAAALTRRNALAAERILEHRLLDSARNSPPVPQALRARVLAAAAPPNGAPRASARPGIHSVVVTGSRPPWWQLLRNRQWLGLGGVAVLAGLALMVVIPLLQQANGPAVQVAMVMVADRTPLFESSDARVRGGTPQPPPPADLRFRDILVPLAPLHQLVGSDATAQAAAAREIAALLPATTPPAGSGGAIRLVVDAALKQKIETSIGASLPVRIYDLADPRSAEIRRLMPSSADDRQTWLLTTRP